MTSTGGEEERRGQEEKVEVTSDLQDEGHRAKHGGLDCYRYSVETSNSSRLPIRPHVPT